MANKHGPKKVATPAAPKAAQPPKSAVSQDPAESKLHSMLAVFAPLCDAHGALLELPPAERFVPGAVVHLHAHHPISVERFVEEARACTEVRAVHVLAGGVRLEVAIPSPPQSAKAKAAS